MARELDLLNRDRREAETRILFAAEGACAPQAAAGAIVVAGEGWHPGVVGIVASRLVERWRRPCVVIALDGDSRTRLGPQHLAPTTFTPACTPAPSTSRASAATGWRPASSCDAEALEPFRRALAAHAGAALTPSDLRRREHVDAVVPGGALTLELAEELERLRPFGCGNPQPSLLVPGARVENVAGMGDERQHARFNLVTAGGSRSRGVAFGSAPAVLTAAAKAPHDIVLRLERNRWNGRGGAAHPAAGAVRVAARRGARARRGRLVLGAARGRGVPPASVAGGTPAPWSTGAATASRAWWAS